MFRNKGGTIKTRILTAVVLLPALILFVLYSGATFFRVGIALVSLLALWEFFGMCLPAGRRMERGAASFLGAGLVALASAESISLLPMALTVIFMLIGVVFLFRPQDLTAAGGHLAAVAFGLLYLPLLLSSLPLLRELPHGREWLFLVMFIVMAGDTMAYFVGVSIGRHKLYPLISPNKSIEGAVGGLGGSLLAAFVSRWWFFQALTLYDCIVLAILLGIAGQLGDLFESMLKRSYGVKDSGTMIPGHGGLLDRLDSLLFAFPAAYLYAFWRFSSQVA